MKTVLHIVLVGVIGMAAATSAGAQETWVGKTIVLKKDHIPIGYTADDGRQVYVAYLNLVNYTVIAEQDGWLGVNDGRGHAGWFDKADAVVLNEAVAYFSEMIRRNPDDATIYNRRAVTWMLKGDLDVAIQDYSEVLRLAPGAYAYNNRGNAWRHKKDFDKAIADYNEAIRLEPKSLFSYMNRGVTWTRKKDYDKAIADFTEAVRLDPNSVFSYVNRAAALCRKKEWDKAIADSDEAIKLSPRYALAHTNRGNAWSGKKEYAKALADYNEAIRLDGRSASAYAARAWLWATCPDPQFRDGEKAVESAKRALAIDSKNGVWLETLAAAYAESSDFAEAVRLQERALEDPECKNDDAMRRRLELYRDKKAYRQD